MVALMDARHLRLLEVAGDPEEIAIDHRELRLPDGRVPIHSLNIVQEIPSPEAIKRLVAAGLGISYVFRLGVEQELASGKLMKIHCPKLNTRQPFSILFPQGPAPSGIVHAFVQSLLEKDETKTQPA